MKKIFFLLFLVMVINFCARTTKEFERIIEEGTEIINNPIAVQNKSPLFSLTEEFVCDLEEDEIAALGLTDIWGFDVDSKESIYLFKPPMSEGDRILKFDRNGDFLFSFAPPGQGPGETLRPSYQKMISGDVLPVPDIAQSKILFFNPEGQTIEERHMEGFPASMGSLVYFLDNGNYLIRRSLTDPSTGVLHLVLSLFDAAFNEIKELDRATVVQPVQAEEIRFPMFVSVWCTSRDRIFIGNENNGYEIQVFDFEGRLLRKIRKKYIPVKIGKDYQKEIQDKMGSAPDFLKEKIFFPDNFPPFNYLFVDDQDNLFVKTFVQGLHPNEWAFDVFNAEGILQGTVFLEAVINDPFFTPGAPFDSWVMSKKKNRLYSLREKSSGYKVFVVWRLN